MIKPSQPPALILYLYIKLKLVTYGKKLFLWLEVLVRNCWNATAHVVPMKRLDEEDGFFDTQHPVSQHLQGATAIATKNRRAKTPIPRLQDWVPSIKNNGYVEFQSTSSEI